MKATNNVDGTVIFELNAVEADILFDPYDPKDQDLPSHLHHCGHRYIKDAAYEWMLLNIGDAHRNWSTTILGRNVAVTILDKDKAMLFKLAWSANNATS